jgi:hypothetical protein
MLLFLRSDIASSPLKGGSSGSLSNLRALRKLSKSKDDASSEAR